jgi:hypothetical protein
MGIIAKQVPLQNIHLQHCLTDTHMFSAELKKNLPSKIIAAATLPDLLAPSTGYFIALKPAFIFRQNTRCSDLDVVLWAK